MNPHLNKAALRQAKPALKNLFFTRTALGVYAAILGAVSTAAVSLANKYDVQKTVSVTDWVIAVAGVGTAIASSGVVLSARVGANGSLTYTPQGLPGPNKEDLADLAESDCPPLPDDIEFPGE